MASMGPEAVELLFARRLPKEVAVNIFAFGFHIWLSRPFDVSARRRAYTGPDYVGEEQRLITVHLVLHWQLSESARKMFWAAYEEGLVKAGIVTHARDLPTDERDLATPFTIRGSEVEHVVYRGRYLLILRELELE